MDEFQPTIIGSVIEYLSFIQEIDRKFPTHEMLDNPTTAKFLYRGHSNQDYELIPSVFREVKTSLEDAEDTIEIRNKAYLAFSREFYILQCFIAEASAYCPTIETTDYVRWAEIAQHYGAPTRFLDWTSNPLVALYFACLGNSALDGCVWLIHVANYQRCESRASDWTKMRYQTNRDIIEGLLKSKAPDDTLPEYPLLLAPNYIDLRMSAQSSMFMVWGQDEHAFNDMFKRTVYMDYDEELSSEFIFTKRNRISHFLNRVIIRSEDKQFILRELERMGINAKTLFPGLDGVGKYIERKFRFDYEESSMCV